MIIQDITKEQKIKLASYQNKWLQNKLEFHEIDERQYLLMKKCLEGFEVGNVSLRVLIDSLRGLINVLQEPDNEWKVSFMREWWTLEEIYSIALNKEQDHLSETDKNSVYEAVDNIKQLIERLGEIQS